MFTWQSLKAFCNKEFPKKVFKSDNARKAWVLKKGLRLQKDERGTEGVAIPKSDEKEIRLGKRAVGNEDPSAGLRRWLGVRKGGLFDGAHQKNASCLTVPASSQASDQLPCRAVFVLVRLVV